MRHLTENLAFWVRRPPLSMIMSKEETLTIQFGTCDRDRHFELNVPQRAIFCPILRYEIYTAFAGHLTRLAACQGKQSVVFNGIEPSRLTADSAVRCHDICISHLIELSNDPKERCNEDISTAATILRFYEQIDGRIPAFSMFY